MLAKYNQHFDSVVFKCLVRQSIAVLNFCIVFNSLYVSQCIQQNSPPVLFVLRSDFIRLLLAFVAPVKLASTLTIQVLCHPMLSRVRQEAATKHLVGFVIQEA